MALTPTANDAALKRLPYERSAIVFAAFKR